MTTSTRIAFIGGGNMARSLIGGLLNAGWAAADLSVSEPDADTREALRQQFGVACMDDNAVCVTGAEVVVLAVKPQFMRQAVAAAAEALRREQPLLISIAAGIRCADVLRWAGAPSGQPLAIVRAMPNTPALVGAGAAGLFANAQVSGAQLAQAQAILGAVGETLWVEDEALLDAITGISGSGPAYLFKWMELLIDAAVAHGLERAAAARLVAQTALGAALLAKNGMENGAENGGENAAENGNTPAELRRQVTSLGGATEAALREMEARGLDAAMRGGIDAAIRRSAQIADQFGAD